MLYRAALLLTRRPATIAVYSTSPLAFRIAGSARTLTLAPGRRSSVPANTALRIGGAVRWNSTAGGDRPPADASGHEGGKAEKRGFGAKLSQAWSTPTKWYPIPLALGALVLLAVQMRKHARGGDEDGLEVESQREGGAVVKSKRVDGPWQVRVLGALPLRSLSQLWGYLNGLVLPIWFRPFGFRLYARIFGCSLDECQIQDLTQYESLGEFFYRELKPGLRPISDAPMVSPADGRVLHYGEIVGERVEQVKGLTYSLQALLGSEGAAVGERTEIPSTPLTKGEGDGTGAFWETNSTSPTTSSESIEASSDSEKPKKGWKNWKGWRLTSALRFSKKQKSQVVDDEHFANINDIPYSLSSLLGRRRAAEVEDVSLPAKGEEHDASHPQGDLAHDASVALSLGTSAAKKATDREHEMPTLDPNNRLWFFVVYLAPGDYHRFHSPTAWVVERRRHFTGDLFSVSPYIANRLRDLFVLNERVALLGRWKHGFYSMVPVGATNVGSIRINFDESLRTNTRNLSHPPHTFTEAVYISASSILQGQPLLAGEEMGGFRLGSTIVLVFEAPKDWRFTVKAGDKVKVGEAIGRFRRPGEKGEDEEGERGSGKGQLRKQDSAKL